MPARRCAMPGVVAVMTARDIGTPMPTIPLRHLSDAGRCEPYEQPVIAADKVRYVGEPVAVVLAETQRDCRGRAGTYPGRDRPVAAVIELPRVGNRHGVAVRSDGNEQIRSRISAEKGDPTADFPDCYKSARAVSDQSPHRRCRWNRAACWPNGTTGNGRLTVNGAAKVPFVNRAHPLETDRAADRGDRHDRSRRRRRIRRARRILSGRLSHSVRGAACRNGP